MAQNKFNPIPNRELKGKIVALVKKLQRTNIPEIAHELYITVGEAKAYTAMAISEKLIKYDRETKEVYYDFSN